MSNPNKLFASSTTPSPFWKLYHRDCIHAAENLEQESIDLIYIDPPFFTGKTFSIKNQKDSGFQDHWNNDLPSFVSFLSDRIRIMHQLLKPTGSLLLHLDWRAVHYLKVACDEIFGMENFQNEIIWSYQSGGGTKKRYGRKHDTILWYSKSKTFCFNTEEARVPYDAIIAKKREHLFNEKGKVSGDVLSISRPPNHAKEWNGWPTQKPMALMNWIVKVHSQQNDIVADFCCGSGSTLHAAVKNNRHAIGFDLSEDALGIARQRLQTLSVEP